MNQSWEYNQFSYPGKEGSETETPDARANGSSEHRKSHRRGDLAVQGAWGEGAGRSDPVSPRACVRVFGGGIRTPLCLTPALYSFPGGDVSLCPSSLPGWPGSALRQHSASDHCRNPKHHFRFSYCKWSLTIMQVIATIILGRLENPTKP